MNEIDGFDAMAYRPSDEEVALERQYWADMDRVAEYEAWLETQAVPDDFSHWGLDDLLEELDTVRTLTPDQEGIIAEIEAAIAAKGRAA